MSLLTTLSTVFLSLFVSLNILSSAQALVLEDLIKEGKLEETLKDRVVGFYPGSFDPLHLGHEGVVASVFDQHLCDYVIVHPAWGKDSYKNRVDISIRLEMLFATFKDHKNVIVSKMPPIDLQKALCIPDPDRSIDEKPCMKSLVPGVHFRGIMGSDSALWWSKNKELLPIVMSGVRIPEKYAFHTHGGCISLPVEDFVVIKRAGDNVDELKGFLGARPIVKVIESPCASASSTKVREGIQSQASIKDKVSEGVLSVIMKYDLYK